MKFQILIPTIPSRAPLLAKLLASLEPQLAKHPGAGVHVVSDLPGKKETIGEKRQRAIAEATADYVAFIDDDDEVSEHYVDTILPALESAPDCCGITVAYWPDGVFQDNYEHSLRHRSNASWSGLRRTPHHLCPIRRSIAAAVPFPPVNWGEDYRWAMDLLPLLKTEEWLGEEPLYFYRWISGKPPVQ